MIAGVLKTSEQRAQAVDFSTVNEYASKEGEDLPVIGWSVMLEEPVKHYPCTSRAIWTSMISRMSR